MVDTSSMSNGAEAVPQDALPEVVHISTTDANRVPSPGTLRTLKAQLGKSWGELMGPEADDADRFQTIIWCRLRKERPALAWSDCEDVELIIDDAPDSPLAPSAPSSATLPVSAASGD